ncbi:bifunctional uridylate/adenylate kinase [Exophiala dermatitidis]|uniref:Uridylate kinase n=2 Tax=Exophiala dermatitidis TaxID=5970 RepID=H6BN12_EXODN|nr:cytidylate kinase [Exophiala dermatitidis NIH/UT8656]KAJ4518248.1 bifunctional uridylate/adenylate kinase [Exophiala dermatitidis]EHY52136.1 cytidylate kinase [Exophiala dermatitidis NIH/UT8656]KAJ4521146.1 bifunctional uridylate/adenylate kinase [Exophiala dermatitidis]KAJ4547734.1 bifunctional uridylate/adenylate kinase [Exophiala dermatitidis]KAJ4553671.1 bifunctional uridylate/adenylate kinase [Exophiala dermatitidis]
MPAIPAIDPTAGTSPLVQPESILGSNNLSPVFDPEKVTVVYILGGPGAGKGTQSAQLVKDYGFVHLSAGDLLRQEQDTENSQYGQLIKDYIKDGKIVPMEITVKLLENAMRANLDSEGRGKFLIDGFPRKMDQAMYFEQAVCPSKCTIFLDCPEDVMRERLLNRGKTSGRADDNEESIVKRFRTFVETSMPVVDHFAAEGRVVRVPAVGTVQGVYEGVVEGLSKMGLSPSKLESSKQK